MAEQYMMEDAVASIRLHVNHRDPYEEWEKETRQEAFVRAQTFVTTSAGLNGHGSASLGRNMPKILYSRRRLEASGVHKTRSVGPHSMSSS